MTKRIILKISGEALSENGSPFSSKRFGECAQMLADLQKTGVELAVVIGGGNVWRGRDAKDMGKAAADQMGMLATLQNCLYMRDALKRAGADAVVMTAVDVLRFAMPYNVPDADERLKRGQIVLLACGLGNPCFSTDSAVVLRGIELECDAIYMAKNIDGVYTADPKDDKSATLIPSITYAEAERRNLGVMDKAAFVILQENHFPLVRVFALEPADNTKKVLAGDTMGTTLRP